MTPEERQACFDQNGYWPTTFVPRKGSPKAVRHRPEEFQRFPRLPRKIETHAELSELMQQGQGFVFNNRDDRKMLHRVNCESLEVMHTRRYEKLFFENLEEAIDWLNRNYDGWELCGRCGY